MRSALVLSTLLAASGGCAHTEISKKPTKPIEAPAIETKLPDVQPQEESEQSEVRVIETVVQRIREQCGNFPTLESGFVVMHNPDGSESNADAAVMYNVPLDAATMECIIRASIDRALPKLCIPFARPEYGIGSRDKLTLSIECRDRAYFHRGAR